MPDRALLNQRAIVTGASSGLGARFARVLDAAGARVVLAAVPVGGFFDRKVDAFLDVDGVYEASLYLLPVGSAP